MVILARRLSIVALLLAGQSFAARFSSLELDDLESLSDDSSSGNITASSGIDVLLAKMQCKPNINLGLTFDTVAKCAAAAAADASCSSTFMYPTGSLWSSWGCRCCLDTSVSSEHSSWNMYKTPLAAWPAQDTEPCGQTTKQKSIYAYFDYSPSLLTKPAVEIRSSVIFNALETASWLSSWRGGLYAAYVVRTPASGPAGYFGAQIIGGGQSMFLFSMWDADRWDGTGHSKTVKASSKLVWPLNTQNCKRNCNDCGLESLKPLVDLGLTSGTKCTLPHADMSKLGSFSLRFWRKAASYTINTKDYGGFGEGHYEFGEYDRSVTGSRWVLEATSDATGAKMEVGDMLFEGGSEISQLRMFDELIGCTSCNDVYHKDTRLGPFLHDADGTVRKPISMDAQINGPSDCLKYSVSGEKAKHSISFEAGPGAVKNFEMSTRHTVW